MGMGSAPQAGSSGGRGRRRGGGRKAPVSEINVTPLVDVMLVLLIIFMVAAPLMTVGVPIDLPETKAKEMNSDTKPITVSINKEGLVYLGEETETAIGLDELVPKLQAIAQAGAEVRILVLHRLHRDDRAAIAAAPVGACERAAWREEGQGQQARDQVVGRFHWNPPHLRPSSRECGTVHAIGRAGD